jgi:hypothetical protein
VAWLEKYSQESYLDSLESTYGSALEHFHTILSGYLEKGIFGDIPPLPWDELRQRAAILSKNLKSPQPIQGNYQVLQIDGIDTLEVNLTNLMVLPVEIQSLEIDGMEYSIQQAWCGALDCQTSLLVSSPPFVIEHNTSLTISIP